MHIHPFNLDQAVSERTSRLRQRLTHDPATSHADRAAGGWTTPRGRRRRGVRAAALTAGLAITALAGTACEPPPPATCLGVRPTIVGTAGNDTLRGTPGPDVITGLGGRDVVHGLGGGDRLCGGDGVDQVHGGEGDDVVDGGLGGDVITGDIGTDTVDYRAHPTGVTVDLLTGSGPDGDHLSTLENVVGTSHNDGLTADDARNVLLGGSGSDVLRGGGGNDTLIDELGAPNDRNIFLGGSGRDEMRGGTGPSEDLVSFDDSGAPVFVNLATRRASGFGEDEWAGMEGVIGSRVGDTIYGTPGRDLIYSGAGDDLLIPLSGDDAVDGMGGRDRVSYFAAGSMNVDLAKHTAVGEGTDKLFDVEDIEGSPGADVLTGDAGPNVINGGAGTDVCVGGGGADSFIRCP